MEKRIGVRLTEKELCKLDLLAKTTERDWSKVIRMLINQARLCDKADIQLDKVEA